MKLVNTAIKVTYTGTLEVNGQRVINVVSSMNKHNINEIKLQEGYLKQTFWERGIIEEHFVVTKGEKKEGEQYYNIWKLETELEILRARSKYCK